MSQEPSGGTGGVPHTEHLGCAAGMVGGTALCLQTAKWLGNQTSLAWASTASNIILARITGMSCCVGHERGESKYM